MDESQFGKGAVRDPEDKNDLIYDKPLGANFLTDEEWEKGFDIEKEIGCKIPLKNQWGSSSCVAQAFSYYVAVLNAIETGQYDTTSAKAIYSQIALAGGGSYFRDGAKLLKNWGALMESIVKSYKPDGSTDEDFMRDKTWITPEMAAMAKNLQSKDYRSISSLTMDMFAMAIRDGHGMVAGVEGANNGTWSTNEPKPPAGASEWAHALFFGKFGKDKLGKYIATPNSWGTRKVDSLHPDDWQKLREDWFAHEGAYLFCPWVLIDKPNILTINKKDMVVIKQQGKAAIYLLAGEVLIPFASWDAYVKDFPTAKIVELATAEFNKLTVAKANVITAK